MMFKRVLFFTLLCLILMTTAYAAAPTPTPTPRPTPTPIPTVPVFPITHAEPTPLPKKSNGMEMDLEDWYEWYYTEGEPVPNGIYKRPIYIIDGFVQFDEYGLPDPMGPQYKL